MATPCRHIGCKNLVSSRLMKGFCDEHADERYGWHHSKTASERGYGRAWQIVRKQALVRDKYLCQSCKKTGRYVPATDVDHITPKSCGGGDELANLQSLCKSCHRHKTASERGRAGKKF